MLRSIPIILLLVFFGEASRPQSRILGGTTTDISQHPYYVSIEYMGLQWCGGSLIRSNAVLTSASCVDGFRLDVLIARVGHENSIEVANITSYCNHPLFEYLAPSFDYDVSILNLSHNFTLSDTVKLITLQPPNLDIPTGRLATIVGYGTQGWGGSWNTKLQELEMPRVRDIECQEAFPDENITDRMVCFGERSGERDACNTGGSPILYDGKQVGIDSWGYGCAQIGIPRVATRVYNEEILVHIYQCLAND